jgi:hypothetical protein
LCDQFAPSLSEVVVDNASLVVAAPLLATT